MHTLFNLKTYVLILSYLSILTVPPLGSVLEISCQVFTGSQSADATMVTWLVDGHALDLSNLSGRALMSQRR